MCGVKPLKTTIRKSVHIGILMTLGLLTAMTTPNRFAWGANKTRIITDMMGRKVLVPDPLSRVALLGGPTGQVAYVLGARNQLCATFISASAVCVSGIIGWVGLVIPHIGRILVGTDNKYLLPVSALTGAIYLVAVDTIARSAMETEIHIWY
jgi:hypothetical protein